jgi:hypothetical protein
LPNLSVARKTSVGFPLIKAMDVQYISATILAKNKKQQITSLH